MLIFLMTRFENRPLDKYGFKYIVKFLDVCSKSRLIFSSKIGEKILMNRKIFDKRSAKAIFLLIETFQHSQIPLTPAHAHILRW